MTSFTYTQRWIGVLVVVLTFWGSSAADAVNVLVEPFNDATQFTTSEPFFSDGGFDYYGLTDGAGTNDYGGDPAPSGAKAYTGADGSYLNGQDLNGEGASVPIVAEWSGLSIVGVTNLQFSGDFAEFFDAPGDIDMTDFLRVEAQIDGGGYDTVIEFRGDDVDMFNGRFREDTDNDGFGDGPTALSAAFATFTNDISGTGSTLDLRLSMRVEAGDEDFAVDNFQVTGDTTNLVKAFNEPFDDATQFTTSEPFFSDGGFDYFGLTDGAGTNDYGGDPAPSGAKVYTGADGSYLNGQDLNGEGASVPILVEWTGIDVSGLTNLQFMGDFAEFFDAPGDIDMDDFLRVEAQIDGGGYETVIEFRGDDLDMFNGRFREDTDNDGFGDGPIALGDVFATFTADISGTGSTLDLRLSLRVEAGDEDFGIDNFMIIGAGAGDVAAVPEPASAALVGLAGLALVRRRRIA